MTKPAQKFVKLTDPPYVFNSLTNFGACNDRKRKLCESTETCFEKFVKSLQAKLFLVGAILKLCAAL